MNLEIDGLSFKYQGRTVLKRVTLAVEQGEVVSLVGPNGAGKSTLIKCINRILRPFAGKVRVNTADVGQMSLKKMARIFAYVPQTSFHVFPATVFDTVLLGRRPFMNWAAGEGNRDKVVEILVKMNLDHMAMRQFNELSGGERQKILIARALVQEPVVLLLDEPTSNLDLRHQLEVLDYVATIARQKNICVVMAIHDLNLASFYSDRIIFLKNGEIRQNGTPKDVLVPDNIRMVYGVEAKINHDAARPHMIPLKISEKTTGTCPA